MMASRTQIGILRTLPRCNRGIGHGFLQVWSQAIDRASPLWRYQESQPFPKKQKVKLGETETSFATQRNTKRDIKVVNSHFLNRRSHCADQSLLCFTLAAGSILTTLDPSNSTQNSETILQSKPGPGATHAIGSSQTNSALVTPLSLWHKVPQRDSVRRSQGCLVQNG